MSVCNSQLTSPPEWLNFDNVIFQSCTKSAFSKIHLRKNDAIVQNHNHNNNNNNNSSSIGLSTCYAYYPQGTLIIKPICLDTLSSKRTSPGYDSMISKRLPYSGPWGRRFHNTSYLVPNSDTIAVGMHHICHFLCPHTHYVGLHSFVCTSFFFKSRHSHWNGGLVGAGSIALDRPKGGWVSLG
jgi:hypothetical protein